MRGVLTALLLLAYVMSGGALAEAGTIEFSRDSLNRDNVLNDYLKDFDGYVEFGGSTSAGTYVTSLAYGGIGAEATGLALAEAIAKNLASIQARTNTFAFSNDFYSLSWSNSFGLAFAC